jgi:CcmD family protein
MKNFGSIFAAYLIAWAIFFGFLISVSSRLARVQQEIERLKESLRKN